MAVTGYRIYRDDNLLTSVGVTTSYTDPGVALGPHSYEVRAIDAAGHPSDPSNTAHVTVLDTTKPSAPANLDGDGGRRQPDQPCMGRLDRQRRRHGL